MKNIIFIALVAMALSGCITPMSTISTLAPVYEKTAQGHHEDFAYCVVDALEYRGPWSMRQLRYTVRTNSRKQLTQINAVVRQGEMWGVFLMDVAQVDSDTYHISLRGKHKKQLEIKHTIKASDECVRGGRA